VEFLRATISSPRKLHLNGRRDATYRSAIYRGPALEPFGWVDAFIAISAAAIIVSNHVKAKRLSIVVTPTEQDPKSLTRVRSSCPDHRRQRTLRSRIPDSRLVSYGAEW